MTREPGKAESGVHLPADGKTFQWKRLVFMFLGLGLFCVVYFSPPWGPAIDPEGKAFQLTDEGKASLGLFLLAATWWIFEVVPIGVTSITIGVVQALFLIRDPEVAFTDFMTPSVWFIIGSLVIGMVFTKTGLTRRMAYKMLAVVGEKTSMIYLGCFVMTAALTLIMAHTAVAATIFPLLMAIYVLYDEEGEVTKFGKGLFMGMAYTAGAGSIITLLGAARGAVALGFFKTITGREVGFFELTWYMLPIGVLMVFVLWAFFMIVYKPEKARIPGLRERSKVLYSRLGKMTAQEKLTLVIVFAAIAVMSLRSFVPAMAGLHKSAVILTSTVLFFLFGILKIKDLESLPWNIVLLFGGAMSIGFCLWTTGAAEWLAINWLVLFQGAHWLLFVVGMAFFVMLMTNFIMNVAAIAISLPVALVIAPYLGVSGDVVMFAALVTAGMPFLCLVGAAPNAIAYESKQFTSGEFFMVGIPASAILMVVTGLFVYFVWPVMGMPVRVEVGEGTAIEVGTKYVYDADGSMSARDAAKILRRRYREAELSGAQVLTPENGDLELLVAEGVSDADAQRMRDLVRVAGVVEFGIVATEEQEDAEAGVRAGEDYGGPPPGRRWVRVAGPVIDVTLGPRRPLRRGIRLVEVPLVTRSRFGADDFETSKIKVVEGSGERDHGVRIRVVGARRLNFKDFTGRYVGRTLAVILDGRILSLQEIEAPWPGEGVITGGGAGMSREEALDLAATFKAGLLLTRFTLKSEGPITGTK